MDLKTLFDNFEIFATAPGGIARLRSLVLTPAMNGQLVEKNGEWTKEMLGDCVVLRNGRAYSQSELLNAGTLVIRIQNLNGGQNWYFSDLDLPPEKMCEGGDLLFAWSASFGPYIWNGPTAIFHYHIWKIEVGPHLHRDFLFCLLQFLTEEIKRSSHGLAMLHMTKKKMENLVISFPSLSEQDRIVSQLRQILMLCNELEAAASERDALRTAARKSAIDAVSTASTADELSTAWARIRDNWTTYADTPESISDLRSIILDLAIRGFLAKQDDREVKESIEPVDGPFDLPTNWIWSSLEKVGIVSPRNTVDDELDVGFVPMALISERLSTPHQFEIRKWKEIKKGYTHLADGDVALAKITPCFENGKACVVRGLPNGVGAGTTELLVIRSSVVNPDYLLIFLKSNLFTANGIPRMTGTAGQKRLPTDFFKKFPMPIPPYAEQVRIVAKVEELMALCDQLENELKTRDDLAGQWAASSVHHIGDAA